MLETSDSVIYRRKLKRSVTLWRTAAIVLLVITAIGIFSSVTNPLSENGYIARLEIDGVILKDRERLELIAGLVQKEDVKAVIIRIDSPGGTFVGGEMLYKELRKLALKKPLVAVMDGVATSAAYMTAIAADHIVAHEGTLTGSVGVILQTADITNLLKSLGISPHTFKSGRLKGEPSLVHPLSKKTVQITQDLVQELYVIFRNMVMQRRGLNIAEAGRFKDGRVFTGRQALDAGLIDEIGGEREAVLWLEQNQKIRAGLSVITIDFQPGLESLWGRLKNFSRKLVLSKGLTLDGFISLWQPQVPQSEF